MSRLRLSLTIPGAVSLGAYEGGALAALLTAVRSLGDKYVVIDSIGAASAGSMTAVLTAKSLLRGTDPVELLAGAWVEQVSYTALKEHGHDAPLSNDALTTIARKLLGARGPADGVVTQSEPVRLSLSLTSLAGLSYDLPDLQRGDTIPATTYQDWYDVTLTPRETAAAYLRHAQAAIASGSNAMGFLPTRLNRSNDRAIYLAAGLQGFPDDGQLWYTDGGTTDNEPLGRTIDLAHSITPDDGDHRLYLLIHYDSDAAVAGPSPQWSGDAHPTWTQTGARAFSISRAQSLYDDLKRLQKVNSRLSWVQQIGAALDRAIADAVGAAELDADDATRLRGRIADQIQATLASIDDDHDKIDKLLGRPPRATRRTTDRHDRTPTSGDDLVKLVTQLVETASGLDGREHIDLEIVSPAIDPAAPKESQLAGAFLFHFGGFLQEDLRRSDFCLGYLNMQRWLADRLRTVLHPAVLGPAVSGPTAAAQDLDEAVDQALVATRDRYQELGWSLLPDPGAGFRNLTLTNKLHVAGLAGEIATVISHDIELHRH